MWCRSVSKLNQKATGWEGERVRQIIEILMVSCVVNQRKNRWILTSKWRQIQEKNNSKTFFFSSAFLDRFWEGFQRVLGRFCGRGIFASAACCLLLLSWSLSSKSILDYGKIFRSFSIILLAFSCFWCAFEVRNWFGTYTIAGARCVHLLFLAIAC